METALPLNILTVAVLKIYYWTGYDLTLYLILLFLFKLQSMHGTLNLRHLERFSRKGREMSENWQIRLKKGKLWGRGSPSRWADR